MLCMPSFQSSLCASEESEDSDLKVFKLRRIGKELV